MALFNVPMAIIVSVMKLRGDRRNESRSLVLRPGNGCYRDPGSCLGSIRGLSPTDTSARPYSWRTCARVPRGCLAGRGRHGDLVATYRTVGSSGISHCLPYLCVVLGASVVCYEPQVWFWSRGHHFLLGRHRCADNVCVPGNDCLRNNR